MDTFDNIDSSNPKTVYLFFFLWVHLILNEAPILSLLLKFFLKRDKITLRVFVCYYFGKRKIYCLEDKWKSKIRTILQKIPWVCVYVCVCVCTLTQSKSDVNQRYLLVIGTDV